MNSLPVRAAGEKRVIQVVDAGEITRASDGYRRETITATYGERKKRPASEMTAPEVRPSKETQKRLRALEQGVGGGRKLDMMAITHDVNLFSMGAMNKYEKRAFEAQRWKAVTGMPDPKAQNHHPKVAQGIRAKQHQRACKAYEEKKAMGLASGLVDPNARLRNEKREEEREQQRTESFGGTNVSRAGMGREERGGGSVVISRRAIEGVRESVRRGPADVKIHTLGGQRRMPSGGGGGKGKSKGKKGRK